MVVVERPTKSSHFIPLKSMHKATIIGEIYLREIAKMHGVAKTILYDRYSKFHWTFGKGYSKDLGQIWTLLDHIIQR